MRDVQELVDTETSSAGIPDITPEIWASEVEKAAQALRVARNYIKINRDLLDKPGDIVHIPKSGTLTATGISEGVAIVTEEMTGYSTVNLEPGEIGAGVSITRDVVEEVKVDILADATEQLAFALAQKEDIDIYAAMDVAGPTRVYGGTATTAATLAIGDIISTDKFADAVTAVRIANYRPDVMFIHPTQENVFLKDSQFVNASEFGGNEVVRNGTIGKYLGILVVSSTNVPGYVATTVDPADATAWAVDGHSAFMIDSKHAAVMALKRNPTIETDYDPASRMHKIYATMRYAAGILNNGAICIIKVSDV